MKKFIFIIMFLLVGCSSEMRINEPNSKNNNLEQFDRLDNTYQPITNKIGVVGDDFPITREEASRIIALSFYNINNIKKTAMPYVDIIDSDEHYKYISVLYDNRLIQDSEKIRPKDYLTAIELQQLVKKINSNSSISIPVKEETKDTPISYALFTDVVYALLGELSGGQIYDEYGIYNSTEVVLATNGNNEQIPENYIITDYGVKKVSYIDYQSAVNSSILFMTKNNEILFIKEIVSNTPNINFAYVTNFSNNQITIFTGGVYRVYDTDYKGEDITNKVISFKLENNTAKNIVIHNDEINDEIKVINSDSIVFGKSGKVPLHQSNSFNGAKVYEVYGENLRYKGLDEIFVGQDNIKFVKDDKGVIVAGLIQKERDKQSIRVLLNDSSYSNSKFNSVSFTGNLEVNGEAKNKYVVSTDTLKPNQVITINSDTGIKVDNITRKVTGGVPIYKGSIDVINIDGSLVLVNDLPIEEYLKKVVPSEMPHSYNEQALKAQAITARTYAINQIENRGYSKFGADLDDSVLSQVYNNIDEQESTTKAINDTAGEVLMHNGNVITTNFFSTSSGYLANSGDVWPNTVLGSFPNSTPTYLGGKNVSNNTSNIGIEQNAIEFYKNKEVVGVDSDFPWFRWNTQISKSSIRQNINTVLPPRIAIQPYMFNIKETNFNNFDFGEVQNIKVVKRGDSGVIMELLIQGNKYDLLVKGEYNIRKILKPSGDIIRKDNSKISGYSLLPSAYCAIEDSGDNITVYGGGNGHGVGMSQNGADSLANKGYKYDEILKYFYNEVELVKY